MHMLGAWPFHDHSHNIGQNINRGLFGAFDSGPLAAGASFDVTFGMSQRFVGCRITGTAGTSVHVRAPPDWNVAPPGYYMLFIVDAGRVPSTAEWIRLTP